MISPEMSARASRMSTGWSSFLVQSNFHTQEDAWSLVMSDLVLMS